MQIASAENTRSYYWFIAVEVIFFLLIFYLMVRAHRKASSGKGEEEGKSPYLISLHHQLSGEAVKFRFQGYWTIYITASTVYFIIRYVWIDIEEASGFLEIITNKLSSPSTQTNASGSVTTALVYLIFRSTALGVITTAVIYFGARLAMASFDQETRFLKRKMGTTFLEFLYEKHGSQLDNKISLSQFMDYFESWNKSIESAFSTGKTEKQEELVDIAKKSLELAFKSKEGSDK